MVTGWIFTQFWATMRHLGNVALRERGTRQEKVGQMSHFRNRKFELLAFSSTPLLYRKVSPSGHGYANSRWFNTILYVPASFVCRKNKKFFRFVEKTKNDYHPEHREFRYGENVRFVGLLRSSPSTCPRAALKLEGK